MGAFENVPVNVEGIKEYNEEQEKREIAKKLRFSKEKKELLIWLEKEKSLTCLKSALERGFIQPETVRQMMDRSLFDAQEVSEVLSKIEELENIADIDSVLPKSLRLSSQNYLLALEDATARTQALQLLDDALSYLHTQIFPQGAFGVSSFEQVIFSMQDTLTKAHDTTIDIKNSLL